MSETDGGVSDESLASYVGNAYEAIRTINHKTIGGVAIPAPGTARLQTVTAEQNPLVAELLTEYEKLSGIPMLCNTSANHLGKGFFPDVSSVADWDGADAIWSDDTLYRKAARRG